MGAGCPVSLPCSQPTVHRLASHCGLWSWSLQSLVSLATQGQSYLRSTGGPGDPTGLTESQLNRPPQLSAAHQLTSPYLLT